jgi:hypothetical protein
MLRGVTVVFGLASLLDFRVPASAFNFLWRFGLLCWKEKMRRAGSSVSVGDR